ncbi:hypothetical protein OIV83_001904 [Microbotryomycetes sp. JL201]|nr:hypothetical protein OIV83_001904 [Microbotryomycetes sp. JL201]
MLSWVPDRLVGLRKTLLILLASAAATNALGSSALLGYQAIMTEGYNKPVPAILAISAVTTLFVAWFLKGPSIALVSPSTSSSSKRAMVAKFVKSIAFELGVLGGIGAWLLVATADLHADTPGLLGTCGGFAMCRLLTMVFALAWLTVLFDGLAFAALLGCTLYFSIRRHSAIATLTTSFDDVNWSMYASRSAHKKTMNPIQRAFSMKKTTTTTAPRSRPFEDDDTMTVRDSSVFAAPLPRSEDVFVVIDDNSTTASPRKRDSNVVGAAF